jgi:hypothetical protein
MGPVTSEAFQIVEHQNISFVSLCFNIRVTLSTLSIYLSALENAVLLTRAVILIGEIGEEGFKEIFLC